MFSSAQPLAGGAYLVGWLSSVVLVVVSRRRRRPRRRPRPSRFHSDAFFSKTTCWIFLKFSTMMDRMMAPDSMERFSNFSQNLNFSEFFQNFNFQNLKAFTAYSCYQILL